MTRPDILGRRRTCLVAACAAVAMLCGWMQASAQTARTQAGLVEGTTQDGIAVYKGVPFAAPPVGALRWRAPQPPRRWTGVKKTNHFAPACAQVSVSSAALGIPAVPTSEDCLYLNVWTPARSPDAHLPVMVWIYGGGFTSGATSLYDGENLAKRGVVVVSVAYRVGPFGFLADRELSKESGHGSGNYGLLDQIAGLKWVRRNIAAFGGDPRRVTIFGESAGGISVSMLAASPLAAGLFEGAISESGGSFGPPQYGGEAGANVAPLAVAERQGAAFLAALGVSTLAEARALPAKKILAGPGAGVMGGVFWPNFDGYVLRGGQYRLYSKGRYNDTPILVGTNSDEGAIFSQIRDAGSYVAQVRAQYGAYADKILKAYPAANDRQAIRSSRDLLRDTLFAWGTWTWARLQSRTGKGGVYVYYFNHRPPFPNQPPFTGWGAIHGSEIAYVFGNLKGPDMRYTKVDRALSRAIITYWTNFAKYGNPNGPGLPAWPAFSSSRPAVMHFDDRPKAGPVPNLGKLEVLDGYFAWRRREGAPREDAPRR